MESAAIKQKSILNINYLIFKHKFIELTAVEEKKIVVELVEEKSVNLGERDVD